MESWQPPVRPKKAPAAARPDTGLEELIVADPEAASEAIARLLEGDGRDKAERLLTAFNRRLRGPAEALEARLERLEETIRHLEARLAAEPAAPQALAEDTAVCPFGRLHEVGPDLLAPLLANEHPQIVALVLSQLDLALAAGILTCLPAHLQTDVAYRIATMEDIAPAVLKEIEASLEQSLRDVQGGHVDVGGPKIVADILNLTGPTVEKSVLDRMDADGPETAEAVRNLMFVFDDIAKLTDKEIQTLMREVDQKDLVVALKAASAEVKDKVLANMSERVREFINEELGFLGPMRLSDVKEVQLRIVQQVRQLEGQGKIAIVRGDADDTFV